MSFNRFGNSSNFLIWIILIIIATGFGSFGNVLGINCVKVNECVNDKYSRKHYKGKTCYTEPVSGPGFGAGGFGGVFRGNVLFIILVIVLLFLCKDKEEDCCDNVVDTEEDFEYSS